MQLNISLTILKKHSKKNDQILFKSLNYGNYHRVENLCKFLLKKIALYLNSLKKVSIEVDIQ